MTTAIKLTVNGEARVLEVDALLSALSDQLGLHGLRYGWGWPSAAATARPCAAA